MYLNISYIVFYRATSKVLVHHYLKNNTKSYFVSPLKEALGFTFVWCPFLRLHNNFIFRMLQPSAVSIVIEALTLVWLNSDTGSNNIINNKNILSQNLDKKFSIPFNCYDCFQIQHGFFSGIYKARFQFTGTLIQFLVKKNRNIKILTNTSNCIFFYYHYDCLHYMSGTCFKENSLKNYRNSYLSQFI